MSPVLQWHGMWPGFVDGHNICNHRFIRELLDGLRWPSGTRVVRLISCFGKAPRPFWKAADEIWINFSGEIDRWPDWPCFDLHLHGDRDSDRVVCLPLVAWYCQAMNLWPRLVRDGERAAQERFCCFVVSNRAGDIRNRFFARLHTSYRPVDSCGRCHNNTGELAPGSFWSEPYRAFLGQYKFALCFENSWGECYVTEKLVNAYAAGCVPIYWGGAAARKWFNPAAFLSLPAQATDDQMDELIAQIRVLDQDAAAYWRVWEQPLAPAGKPPAALRIDSIRARIQAVLDAIPAQRRGMIHWNWRARHRRPAVS